MRRVQSPLVPWSLGPYWPEVPKLVGIVCLSGALVGCTSVPSKYQYGPRPISDKPVTLAESQEKAAGGAGPTVAAKPEAGAARPVNSAIFLGDVDSAIQEAGNMADRNRIFVLITDGKCDSCLAWEKLLTSPGVLKEKEKRGWIYVKADIRWQKQILERYRLDASQIPVGIVVSDQGNENYRFYDPPSSEAVMRQWLIDRA